MPGWETREVSPSPQHADVPRLLEELRTADRRRRERSCDGLAQSTVELGAVPFLVLQEDDPAQPTVLYAARYWQRRIARRPAALAATECGTWMASHALPRLREQLLEEWLLRIDVPAPLSPDDIDAVVDAVFTQRLPPEAVYAAFLYRAGRLWQQQAASKLASWLEGSPVATALPEALRSRPVVRALRAWVDFWSPDVPRAQAHLRWGRAWDTTARHNELVADILLDALTSPWQRGGAGELLSAADRLARHAALAAAAHPDSHRVLYHHARGLREIGERRRSAAALRAARRRLPHHSGDAHWRNLYRAEGAQLLRPWR